MSLHIYVFNQLSTHVGTSYFEIRTFLLMGILVFHFMLSFTVLAGNKAMWAFFVVDFKIVPSHGLFATPMRADQHSIWTFFRMDFNVLPFNDFCATLQIRGLL